MKRSLLVLLIVTIACSGFAQNVGIGITIPLARLHVKDSSVLFSATSFAPASPGNPPISGAGRRMMWYADKAAFRVGFVDGAQWDKVNIGNYSFAAGNGTIASGENSVAMGTSATAEGISSLAIGINTNASGLYSMAFGPQSIASADFSTAIGATAIASGHGSTSIGITSKAIAKFSIAIGENVTANSLRSISLGSYNDPIVQAPNNEWTLTDPLLIVGNGPDFTDIKNAFVIGKNGHVYIDPSNKSNGTLGGNSLMFGDYHLSGEGINSKRTANENQDGLDFYTASNIRMSITNSGNIGINNTTPTVPLSFAATTGPKISLYSGTANAHYGFGVQGYQLQVFSDNVLARISFGYYTAGAFTERMFLDNNTGVLNVAGINYASDERFKKQITPLQNPIEKIESINGVEYYMRADEFPSKHFDNKLQVGLLAQEVEKILPQAVQTGADGYKGIDYARLVPLLVEGIKEQQKQINELKMLLKKTSKK